MRITLHSYRWLVLLGVCALALIFLIGMPALVHGVEHENGESAADRVDEESELTEETDKRPRVRPLPFGEARSLNEDHDASSTLRDRLQDRRDGHKETREGIRDRFGGSQGQLDQRVKGRFMGLMALIGARFNAAIDRFERIANRIDSRISTLDEGGLELSEALALVAESRAHIANAQTLIDEVLDALELALESDTPREDFAAIRDTLHNAKNSLLDARKAFREALSLMKKMVKEELGVEALDDENEVEEEDDDDEEEEDDE